MQNGRENDNFRMLNRALKHDNLPDAGRAYLLKLRGHTHYMFGEFEKAGEDLGKAAALSPMDASIMGLQVRVWVAQKKNLDEAYSYAVSLIKAFPSSVENWSILAMAVRAKEGEGPALEILERVGRVAEECSELFLQLGDLRAREGLAIGAAQAYRKAILLSNDGLVVKDEVEKKLKRLKM
jgi:tetratricopeptide (TPR) repeat protein